MDHVFPSVAHLPHRQFFQMFEGHFKTRRIFRNGESIITKRRMIYWMKYVELCRKMLINQSYLTFKPVRLHSCSEKEAMSPHELNKLDDISNSSTLGQTRLRFELQWLIHMWSSTAILKSSKLLLRKNDKLIDLLIRQTKLNQDSPLFLANLLKPN